MLFSPVLGSERMVSKLGLSGEPVFASYSFNGEGVCVYIYVTRWKSRTCRFRSDDSPLPQVECGACVLIVINFIGATNVAKVRATIYCVVYQSADELVCRSLRIMYCAVYVCEVRKLCALSRMQILKLRELVWKRISLKEKYLVTSCISFCGFSRFIIVRLICRRTAARTNCISFSPGSAVRVGLFCTNVWQYSILRNSGSNLMH